MTPVASRLIDTGLSTTVALASALLTDTVETGRNPALRADVWLALEGASEHLPPAVRALPVFAQRGNSVGKRRVNILEAGFAAGFESVCLIGSDTPHLPLCFVQEAFGRLEAGDEAVFGPAEDGGCYLVGLRRLYPALFADISWGVPEALTETMKAAQAAEIKTSALPPWYDVDTPQDLRRLRIDLQRAVAFAPATAAYLKKGEAGEEAI